MDAAHAAGFPPQVRLGLLLPMFLQGPRFAGPYYGEERSAVHLAVTEINNKTDGIADHLLPNTTL